MCLHFSLGSLDYMLLTRQLRQSDILFLLTSQFIKLLVLVDNLNSTNYPLQIKDPGAFVICGFRSYILTLLSLFYTCLYINEIIIYIPHRILVRHVFMFLFTFLLCIYLSLIFFYQLKGYLMPVYLSHLSLLLCLGFQKYEYPAMCIIAFSVFSDRTKLYFFTMS